MNFVTLDGLKRHLRVDYDEEDALIIEYAETAESIVCEYIGRAPEELLNMGKRCEVQIRLAVYIMVGDYFEQRSAGRPLNIAHPIESVAYLLNPNRRLV